MYRSRDQIREAYRDETVASEYLTRRFREPLGALLHDRQVAVVGRLLGSLPSPRVLEVAPGPARVTADLPSLGGGRGIAVDASLQMLTEARRRLGLSVESRWRFVQGDAFRLPLCGPFDLAYSFRLIRHFDDSDRRRLYGELHRMIRPGGVLIFDAVNEVVSAPLRRKHSGEYRHFDALVRPETLRQELSEAGFETISLTGVQHRYSWLHRLQVLVAPRSPRLARRLMEIVDASGGEPLEWIVTCRRK